jgi:SAM-dependent methyltransferase
VYHACATCDFIQLDPAHLPAPAEEKARYDTHENRPDNAGYVAMLAAFLDRAVLPWREGKTTALDFGCGPGPVLAGLLEQAGFAVDVYDPFYAPHRIYEGRTYDVVTGTEVVEHLHAPGEVFDRLARLLAPGGILALTTRFHPGVPDAFLDWWYRRDPTHVAFYTPRTFRALAARLDLDLHWHDARDTVVLRKP